MTHALQRTGRTIFAVAACAALTMVFSVGDHPVAPTKPAQAEDCTQYVTHWGRIRSNEFAARDMARAGLDWKVNEVLRGRYVSTARIIQCKIRQGRGWQCQAGANVNRCV